MVITNNLLTRTYAFHTFQINLFHIFSSPNPNFGASWEEMGTNQRRFFSFHIYIYQKKVYVYFFFQFSSYPRILISGILGKNEVRPPLFIYIFSSPNPNFGTFWEKWSWTQLVKYPFVFGHSIRQ